MKDVTLPPKTLAFHWLGLQDYEQALGLQIMSADEIREGAEACVLACEHEPVITLGKRALALNDLLVSMDQLREKKIKIVGTDRGGQATFHNPGQLVLYPIIPIKNWALGVREYVECLERTTAYFLAERGVEVTRGYEPGLWVEGRKIAAFGIRVDRGVTLHGVAINIFNDLSDFSLIRQCGATVQATNLQKEMESFNAAPEAWDMSQEAKRWTELFKIEINNPTLLAAEPVEERGLGMPSELA